MTEFEKMTAGLPYNSSDPELVKLHRKTKQAVWKINQMSPEESEERNELVKQLFGSAGEHLHVEPPFHCDYGCNISVGDHFYANFDLVILDGGPVTIGKNCLIGPQVGIYTATHPLDAYERCELGIEASKPVTIGDNCWIGGHAVINPGVTLGDGVVVGSGSVVTKSFGDRVVLAGNPARVIRRLDDEEKI